MSERTPFAERVRIIRLKKALGHNPFAPNCIWSEPMDLCDPKKVCDSCGRLARRFRL